MRGQKKRKNIYHLDGPFMKKSLEGSKAREGTEQKTVKDEKKVRFLVLL